VLPPEIKSAPCPYIEFTQCPPGGSRILVPPSIITCADDQKAIQKAKRMKAKRMVDGHDIELWDGARLVTRIKSRQSSAR
jgi:hypothetical protein